MTDCEKFFILTYEEFSDNPLRHTKMNVAVRVIFSKWVSSIGGWWAHFVRRYKTNDRAYILIGAIEVTSKDFDELKGIMHRYDHSHDDHDQYRGLLNDE